jgi:hypothetical protein
VPILIDDVLAFNQEVCCLPHDVSIIPGIGRNLFRRDAGVVVDDLIDVVNVLLLPISIFFIVSLSSCPVGLLCVSEGCPTCDNLVVKLRSPHHLRPQ